MAAPVYVLGGHQTDFARNWMKEGNDIVDMIKEAVSDGFTSTGIDPHEVDVAHVGNFAAELYCKQGHLGAFLAEIDPGTLRYSNLSTRSRLRVRQYFHAHGFG